MKNCSLMLVVSEEMPITFVVNGEMLSFVDDQWRIALLYWWPLEKCPVILIDSGKNPIALVINVNGNT